MNQELYDQIKEQFAPIFNKFYKTSSSYKKYLESYTQLNSRLLRIQSIGEDMNELQEIVSSKDIPSKYHGIMTAFAYLLRVEVLATFFIDLTLLLLIDEHTCLHLDPDDTHKFVRHASSLEDIESPDLPLSRKLAFLETHKITFFKRYIDKTLRNRIAHGNFFVDVNGDFYTINPKGNKNKEDLIQKINKLTNLINALSKVFIEEFKKSDVYPGSTRETA